MGRILKLWPHPDAPPLAVRAVEVRLWSPGDPDSLSIDYRVVGARHLIVPEPAAPGRADALWKATCFELFVRPLDGPEYFEFNLSPSGQWAAYAFDSHRAGMRDRRLRSDPSIEIERQEDCFLLRADLDLVSLPTSRLRAGLSAILEEEGGHRSYWALAHPHGDPDFHDPDCFVVDLPPPDVA